MVSRTLVIANWRKFPVLVIMAFTKWHGCHLYLKIPVVPHTVHCALFWLRQMECRERIIWWHFIFMKAVKKPLKNLPRVLTMLQEAFLDLKLKRCRFLAKLSSYPEHSIRSGWTGITKTSTRATHELKNPTLPTNVPSSLNIYIVFLRFVRDVLRVASPLEKRIRIFQPSVL